MLENKAPEVIWIDHECPEDGWSDNNEFCGPEYTAYISTTASDSALKAVGLCRTSDAAADNHKFKDEIIKLCDYKMQDEDNTALVFFCCYSDESEYCAVDCCPRIKEIES